MLKFNVDHILSPNSRVLTHYIKVGSVKSNLEGPKIKKSAITARKSYGGGTIGKLLAARDSQSRELIKN